MVRSEHKNQGAMQTIVSRLTVDSRLSADAIKLVLELKYTNSDNNNSAM